jgi:DNA-binding NtrC family response regulator
MLIRVLLAVETRSLDRDVRVALQGEDMVIESVIPDPGFWVRVSSEAADVLIVSRTVIPSPAAETIRVLRESPEGTQVIVITGQEDPEDRARLTASGCEAVIPVRLSPDLLRDLLLEIVQRRREFLSPRLEQKDVRLDPRLSDFVTSSPAMQAFMDVVKKVTGSGTTLLIQGETGVGKERLARAIHAESRRREGPFIAVNCGALPETLLESELFGHVEGAFTGATRSRRGWFELAHGGTLLLDEVGDVPLHLQVKLLRVLQDHEVQPIGSEKSIRVDVRVMTATNRDLQIEVEAGTFRADLFYRIGVVTLRLPPLRERVEDVRDLASGYFEYYRDNLGRDLRGVDRSAFEVLESYKWPGNVRELMNVLERAVLLSDGPWIRAEDLPLEVRGTQGDPRAAIGREADRLTEDWLDRPWKEVRRVMLQRIEHAYLTGLLARTRGRIGETARRAGISPRSLYDKMKSLGLSKEEHRLDGGHE